MAIDSLANNTYNYGQIVTIVIGQRAIAIHNEILSTQEMIQKTWMIAHDLRDLIQDQIIHVELLSVALQ